MDCKPDCPKCKRYTMHTIDEKWFLKPWKRKPRMGRSKNQKCDRVRSQIFSACDTETRTVMCDNTIKKRKSSGCGTVSSGMPPGLKKLCAILGRQLIPSKSSATSSIASTKLNTTSIVMLLLHLILITQHSLVTGESFSPTPGKEWKLQGISFT